jgi:hypothetical protein
MKKIEFLRKPFFFVFNLVFAAWLVLAIEKVKPSDFGSYSSFFEPNTKSAVDLKKDKPILIEICNEYKTGRIDSVQMSKKLEVFLSKKK